jgi:prepilin-type N-terminal cleavage/methylation domain-containing protein
MQRSTTRLRVPQQGFSILEMLLATMILLVGLVAVAQLVPASVLMNYSNRMDSSALVFAQRELDQMLDQPLTSNAFLDSLGNFCQLGNPGAPNVLQGNAVTVSADNRAIIDFGPPPVAGYSFLYTDPTDPNGATYDVRWAVIITSNGGTESSRRFLLGVRQLGGRNFISPVTLDTMVTR